MWTKRLLAAPLALAASLALSPAVSAQGAGGEFLSNFAGNFSGRGTLSRDDGSRNVSCSVVGQPQGGGVSIQGDCGVAIFRSSVSAVIQYDSGSGAYSGVWQDRNSTSDLAGGLAGDTLTLSIDKRGDEAGSNGQMVIRSMGPDQFQLTVSTTSRSNKPRTLNITLQRG